MLSCSRTLFSGFVLLAAAVGAPACDLCAVFSAGEARGEVGKGVFAGLAEQFTHYGTLQQEGREVANPAHQYLDSSITQVLLGYNFTERFGLQFSAPLLYRSFQRPEGLALERGTESGLGDVALTAHYQVFRHDTMNSTFTWNVLGGVKFPTGSTRRLEEETQEMTGPGIPSGIHGHDLTLGSGSFDGVLGTSFYARWKRGFLAGSLQYAIRSAGDFGYQFANDLVWSGGPGWLALLKDNYTLSVQVNVSGETKGLDSFGGGAVGDTGLTAVYLGPQVLFTWRDHLSAQVGLDLPVVEDNTGLQVVADYRIRAAATWHF